MKIYEVEMIQELHGTYKGILRVIAKNRKEAREKIKSMSNEDLDGCTEWKHGDDYYGDVDSIEFNSGLIKI